VGEEGYVKDLFANPEEKRTYGRFRSTGTVILKIELKKF
jgi:hypothetical protein